MTIGIGSMTLANPYLAAPMCGISFLPYRQICRRFGAAMAATQMLAAPALIHADEKTRRLMLISDEERPVTIQLLGCRADELAHAAAIVQDAGADMVDLNMGCPAKKIVGSGGGSALMRDLELARQIFRAMRKVLRLPFTIKIRAGWDEAHCNFLDIARLAEAEGVDAVTLHARTKSAAYTGKADWDLVRQLKKSVSIPVIGNGDVKDWRDARRMREETLCDAVMIGRAAFETPWIFKELLEERDYAPSMAERKALLVEQYAGMVAQFGERNGVILMRKFACATTKGLPNGSQFRQELLNVMDFATVLELLDKFFEQFSEQAGAALSSRRCNIQSVFSDDQGYGKHSRVSRA